MSWDYIVVDPFAGRFASMVQRVRGYLTPLAVRKANYQKSARDQVLDLLADGCTRHAAEIADMADLEAEFPALIVFDDLENMVISGSPSEREQALAALPAVELLLKQQYGLTRLTYN